MRWKFLLFIIAIGYFLLLGRIYSISIKSHKYYETLSKNNITRTIYLKPTRGIIYDDHHIPIAYNKLRFNILVKPHLKLKELNATLNYINTIIPLNINKSIRKYKSKNSSYNHKYIIIKEYIKYKKILSNFSRLSLHKNIKIEPTYLRIYPFKAPMSHIIGYISKADRKEFENNPKVRITKMIGKTGIEKEYDNFLQGNIGKLVVEVNARNKVLKELNKTLPSSTNIELNIDANLQKYIYSLFKKSNKKGVAVVMGVNGRVLAMVSYPSYDNNLFVRGISLKNWNKILYNFFKPFVNKAINGKYPPGSVVKPALGLISLDEKIVSPYEKILCPGYLEVGHRKFRDWKRDGHGEVDIFKSIKRSVDVYYYKMSLHLGINTMHKYMTEYGFGKKTGIDLPKESSGLYPDKLWKQKRYNQPWYIGETLNTAIGQGYFLATPLQVAVNTAFLATGYIATPFVVKKIGNKLKMPKLKEVLSAQDKRNLKYIRKGMWEVCNSPGGTATRHIHTKIVLAGKTGTAQTFDIPQEVKRRKREDELAYFRRSHAWLTTYGPYKHPQYVVTVLIEHGGHGGEAAGGIVSDIYNKLIELKYIK